MKRRKRGLGVGVEGTHGRAKKMCPKMTNKDASDTTTACGGKISRDSVSSAELAVQRQGLPVRMNGFDSREIKTEIEELEDIGELFYAVAENLKSEESNTVDTKPAIDIPLLLHCRLCANPNNSMTDIFDFHAASKDILSKINLCLSIMVKETDTLPKQVCQSCLWELERCYRFHQSVAEAEKQLLTFRKLPSDNLEKVERQIKLETLPQCDKEDGSTEQDNIYERFETTSEVKIGNATTMSSPGRTPTLDTTVKSNVLLSCLRPCSVVLSIAEIGRKDNSEANSEEKSPSHSKRHNPDLTTETIDLPTTTTFGIVQQTICDSKLTESTNCRSAADKMQGNGAKHQVDEAVQGGSHTGERLHRCTICEKLLKTKKSLSIHLKLHSGPRELYKCDICSKMFIYKNNLGRHLKSHFVPRELYECDFCSKMFKDKATLSVHLKLHSTTRELFKCVFCSKMLTSKCNLSRHLKLHSGPRERYKCDFCSKTFLTELGLSRHIKAHSGPRKLYECDLCSRIFKSEVSLRLHHKFHTGAGLFSCEYCGKKFLRQEDVIRHNVVHTGEQRFNCTKCEKTYTRASALRKHTAAIHSDKRNHQCSLCDKSFKTMRDKTNHMLVHTADKNKTKLYQCHHCERYTKRKCRLVNHLESCKERHRSENVIVV